MTRFIAGVLVGLVLATASPKLAEHARGFANAAAAAVKEIAN